MHEPPVGRHRVVLVDRHDGVRGAVLDGRTRVAHLTRGAGVLHQHAADLLELGRQVGILPTFEYISFFKSVYRLADAWDIVQRTADPDSTIILDAFHNWNSNSTLDDLREIPLEKISHYHIDDAALGKAPTTQTDPDRVMIGEGQIDLAAEIAVLKEIGYDKTVSLELFNAELWEQDPLEVISTGLARMKSLFV